MYSDEHALNKWGFLYIQFRASAYYFIGPVLLHTLLKAMFIAFSQKSGVTQAVALIILEVAALIATSVLRPYMDKSTNAINVTICVVNFLNAVFLLIFTDVFNGPGLMIGVVGILLWILNAAVSLILLLILIITTVVIFFKSNPDNRYQLADDRTSFMKSGSVLNTTQQLDALAATARGDQGEKGYVKAPIEDDDDEDSINPVGSSTANLPGHRDLAVNESSLRNSATSEETSDQIRPSSIPSTNGSSASMRMDASRGPVPVSPLASSSGAGGAGISGVRAANNAR